MTLDNLRYISDTEKRLFRIYQENNDIVGLSMLCSIFISRTLNEIIKDLKEVYLDKSLSFNEKIGHYQVLISKYENLLHSI